MEAHEPLEPDLPLERAPERVVTRLPGEIVARGEGVLGVDAHAQPRALRPRAVNHRPNLAEVVPERRALPRHVLDAQPNREGSRALQHQRQALAHAIQACLLPQVEVRARVKTTQSMPSASERRSSW